jgi:hypothetical protein
MYISIKTNKVSHPCMFYSVLGHPQSEYPGGYIYFYPYNSIKNLKVGNDYACHSIRYWQK